MKKIIRKELEFVEHVWRNGKKFCYLSCAGAIVASLSALIMYIHREKVISAYNLESAYFRNFGPIPYEMSMNYNSLYNFLILLACVCAGYALISLILWISWNLKRRNKHNAKMKKGE